LIVTGSVAVTSSNVMSWRIIFATRSPS